MNNGAPLTYIRKKQLQSFWDKILFLEHAYDTSLHGNGSNFL